jgi:hypothetical protein
LRTQYPEMQTSAYDVLMNSSAALKPFRPFDTAGGFTTDWICTTQQERIHHPAVGDRQHHNAAAVEAKPFFVRRGFRVRQGGRTLSSSTSGSRTLAMAKEKMPVASKTPSALAPGEPSGAA